MIGNIDLYTPCRRALRPVAGDAAPGAPAAVYSVLRVRDADLIAAHDWRWCSKVARLAVATIYG